MTPSLRDEPQDNDPPDNEPPEPQDAGADGRFLRLLREHDATIRRAVFNTCPGLPECEAEDILQNARVRLLRVARGPRRLDAPQAYVWRVAVTTAFDAFRSMRARPEVPWIRMEDEDWEPATDSVRFDADPERRAEARDTVAVIESSLRLLNANRRQAVILYLHGYSSSEIAETKGWTEPKARNLTYRGLGDLRRHLRTRGVEPQAA